MWASEWRQGDKGTEGARDKENLGRVPSFLQTAHLSQPLHSPP